MGITKLLAGAVKAAAKETEIAAAAAKAVEKTTAKTTTAVITRAAGTVSETLPDIVKSINTNAKYYQYSPKTQQKVHQLREFLFKYANEKNNPQIFNTHEEYIKNLINYCSDEKTVYTIAGSMGNYNKYCNFTQKIFKAFKNAKYLKLEDKEAALTNLTLMSFTDPKSFKALIKSKGIDEIISGRLNISYLKNIKSTDKIDENYFYKLFDNIEKATNERLVKSGLDKDIVNKYLKNFYDDEVCLNPDFANEFITRLEKIKNPELTNKILNKFPMDGMFKDIGHKEVLKLIDKAAEHPQEIQKVIQLQKTTPGMANHYANFLINKKFPEIEDLFNYYIKFEKAHPDVCQPETLSCMCGFIEKGGDKKLLEEICNKAVQIKDPEFIPKICGYAGKDNFDLLKTMLKNNTLDAEALFKLEMSTFDKDLTEKAFKETYLPLLQKFKKYNIPPMEQEYLAARIAKMQIRNPEEFAKLQNTKVLDLIKEGKINPGILNDYTPETVFTPEILSDIQKLLNNESLIKKFDTTKNILQKTTTGDVISVKGKLYINNNGHLEPWNMTEEKFNELFPLVDRFSTRQGVDDCYFISPLTEMYRNPKTRGEYYKMFEQKGDDICVTIPAYKDYCGEVRFPNGQIKVQDFHAQAAKNVQMLEQAYGRTALRTPQQVKSQEILNPLTTDNLEFIQDRIKSGSLNSAMRELLPKNALIRFYNDKNRIKDILKDFANDKRTIIQEGSLLRAGGNVGHARTVAGYNPLTKTVTLIDPNQTAVEETVPLDEFMEKLCSIIVARPV